MKRVCGMFVLMILEACSGLVPRVRHNSSGSSGANGAGSSQAAPSGLSFAQPSAIYVYNDVDSLLSKPITNIPTVTGDDLSFSINPDLVSDTGLAFDPATGIISGSPTQTTAATTYTVTATNSAGSTSATVVIQTAPGFYVNSNDDSDDASLADNDCQTAQGDCTLRAALTQLNAMSNAAIRSVVIPAMTISAGSGMTISNKIEIVGASAATTIIEGPDTNTNLFSIDPNLVGVKFSQVTLRNADRVLYVNAAGSDVTLSDAIVRDSHGIMVTATWCCGSTLHVDRSAFIDNVNPTWGAEGGAIACFGPCIITDSVFSGNLSMYGGAISGSAQISGSLFVSNSSGVSYGGAVHLYAGSSITNSTFYDNTGGVGAAIHGVGAVAINNCTITGNAGSKAVTSGANDLITMSNTIVESCGNTVLSAGHNLTSDTYANCGMSAGQGDWELTNPQLGALQDNGGPTHTFLPAPGSPAIDTGDDALCESIDQRGQTRPAGGHCDIGAVEQ